MNLEKIKDTILKDKKNLYILIGIVVVIILIILIFSLGGKKNIMSEATLEQKLEEVGKDFYENKYYSGLDDEQKKNLANFSENGIRIDITNLEVISPLDEDVKKQLEKEKELLEAKKSVMEGFKQEEIDTLEKLYKFCDKFEYSTTKFQFCADIVKEYLLKNISKFITNNNNTMQLMDILETLIDKEKISTVEFTRIMYEYIKKEVQKDEYINTTC